MGKNDELLLELTDQERARFEAKVWQLDGACWPWIGSTTWGYGDCRLRKIKFRAHRVAYCLASGELIPDGLDICHSCDYRRCCNPAHLTAKTTAENVADMMKRGRHWSQGFVYVEPPMPEVPEEVRLAGLQRLLVANFWGRVQQGSPMECWPWTGSKNKAGYGRIEMKCRELGLREQHLAHVLSYELHTGAVPEGKEIMHACHNPPCVNPRHLTPGTHAENMAAMRESGRSSPRVGELNYNVKLDAASVSAIRVAVRSGMARKALAEHHGVHVQTIHDIVSRKSWDHVP